MTDLRDALLLAETASAAAGGAMPATGEEGAAGAAAQPDAPARPTGGSEIAATLEANRKLAVINGMGDHNRAQVQRVTRSMAARPALLCAVLQPLSPNAALMLFDLLGQMTGSSMLTAAGSQRNNEYRTGSKAAGVPGSRRPAAAPTAAVSTVLMLS